MKTPDGGLEAWPHRKNFRLQPEVILSDLLHGQINGYHCIDGKVSAVPTTHCFIHVLTTFRNSSHLNIRATACMMHEILKIVVALL